MGCLITQGMRPRITKSDDDNALYIVPRSRKRRHGDDGQVRLKRIRINDDQTVHAPGRVAD